MLAHALRAAMLGAMWSAVVGAAIAILFAFLKSEIWPWTPVIAAGSAVAGAAIFGLIGLVSAMLYIKPVGWTFVYAFFGAVLATAATFYLLPSVGGGETSSGEGYSTDLLALVAVAVGALVAGALVAMSLKRAPG